PRRVRRLRGVRAGVPRRSDLLRRRCAGPVESVHADQRRLLRRAGIARRRGQGRDDRERPASGQGPAAAGRGRLSDPVPHQLKKRRPAVSAALPEFPWDTLADAKALAGAHPGGIVDLSVGTPVDPVAPVIQQALAAAATASGYPATAGTPRLRESAVAALDRRFGITGLGEAAVLPVIGSKELIAWLPTLLGLGPADVVVAPELAYPTYDVGARLAGARVLRADSLTQLGPQSPSLYYLNSPGNPTGRVLGA